MAQSYKIDFISSMMVIATMITLFLISPSETLDAKLYYTGAEASQFLWSLSVDQKYLYLRTELVDLFFIFSYSTFMILLGLRMVEAKHLNIFGNAKWRYAFVVLAPIPALFDLVETATIINVLMTNKIPQPLDWLGIATSIKWTLAALIYIPLLIGGYKLLQNFSRVRSQTQNLKI